MSQVPEITVDELRGTLAQGGRVRVLDVRPALQRADWWIPDSDHIDAYVDLKSGDPSTLLRGVEGWNKNEPIVAVCNMGRTSRLAVAALVGEGFDASSLAGGMMAWSLAWNTADVELPGSAPAVLQVRRTGKGCLSYLVYSGDEALVIDPSVDPEVYLSLARDRSCSIVGVLDTHVHADHVSRALQLAQAAGAAGGAPFYLPAQDRVHSSFTPIEDGQEIAVGDVTVRAIATPGHTHESMCYILGGAAIATGDTLFLEGVGRPDLKATGEDAELRARLLYRALRERIFALADSLVILPCHACEPVPFDGSAHASPLAAVRAAVSLPDDEDEFVVALLERVPPTPPNYEAVVRINEGLDPRPDDLSPLEAGANRCAIPS